jgi:hypothetical protein
VEIGPHWQRTVAQYRAEAKRLHELAKVLLDTPGESHRAIETRRQAKALAENADIIESYFLRGEIVHPVTREQKDKTG